MIEKIIEEAKSLNKTIVLPESDDERILKAAKKIDFCKIIIIGEEIKLEELKNKNNITIINPLNYEKTPTLIEELYNLRKNKGLTYEEAENLIKNNYLYFGCMLVKLGIADGLVSGAKTTSSNVLRAALQVIKASPNTSLVSSFFLMELKDTNIGENGFVIFSDCGLNLNPTSEELVCIAYSSANSFKKILKKEPKIAMLSHSTYGSSKYESALKMSEATKMFKEKYPNIIIDGELQLDAAIIPEIREKKAPSSPLDNPNIFIFPNIDAGNIGYKLTERLAGAKAYGPLTQGLNKPVNDLSRGCSVEDIIGVVAITCIQAK